MVYIKYSYLLQINFTKSHVSSHFFLFLSSYVTKASSRLNGVPLMIIF